MKHTGAFVVLALSVTFVSALATLTIIQNKADMKSLREYPPLEVGKCYMFSQMKDKGDPVFKITNYAGGIAYTERTWAAPRGWDNTISISERHSKFYTAVKCPKEEEDETFDYVRTDIYGNVYVPTGDEQLSRAQTDRH